MDTARLLSSWTEMANTAVRWSSANEKLAENATTTGVSMDGDDGRQLRQAEPRSLRGRTVAHSHRISKRVRAALDTIPRQLCAVAWFVKDHARGEVFESLAAAQESYDEKDGGLWPLRLYDANGEVIRQFGTLQDSRWSELDRWRNEHVLSAVAPPRCEEFCHVDVPASDMYDLTCPDIQTARMLATMSLEDPDMSLAWCCRRQRVWIRNGARKSHPIVQPGTPNRDMTMFYRRTVFALPEIIRRDRPLFTVARLD
ncbi:hypothetical protein CYMTET_53046 [Cymbomonas tetramitiformis]|uniref:Uncharacterized protein n=1 Tax=Cymbomonas tetramitiformis TaxID=36881 RepID=A0AAE0BJ68_9CHLO|nr:hypothetical protein CYMTET_53046 [Cymbomonas tetramitiformis]